MLKKAESRKHRASAGNHLQTPPQMLTCVTAVSWPPVTHFTPQYQYDGNAHLVYAILRRKDVFVKLANLTLPLAIKGMPIDTYSNVHRQIHTHPTA